jgi:hypothetical protein
MCGKEMKGAYFWINLEDRDNIIDLDVDHILMNRIYEYDLSRAEVSLIETAVNCAAPFNIHFAAIFEHFLVASISMCFHGHIARSTV